MKNLISFFAGVSMLALPAVAATPTPALSPALPAEAWECAQWISAPDAPVFKGRMEGDNIRSADGASWFTATVRNPKKVTRAVWMTTALGVYDIYVNSSPVGEEFLKPGFTHPAKTKRSFTYDITPLLRTGKGADNTLAAEVTPGWWADGVLTPRRHDGMIGERTAFRGVLELTFADGSQQRFGTDTDLWHAGIAGPITHASIFDGEDYDARRPQGFEKGVSLGKPIINKEFNGEILPSDGAEIYLRNDIAMRPQSAYVWEGVTGADKQNHGKVTIIRDVNTDKEFTLRKGETLVVDFGQNCAGVPRFAFKADKGVTLTCLPGELLNDGNGAHKRGMDGPEGSVHRRNLRLHDHAMRMNYTFAGNKTFERYNPTHTFFGFRYISVTADGDVTFSSIESVPVSSVTAAMESGKLSTGNADINRLISNTLWGQRSNYLSVTTDCPQRDERLGWTADTQVFAETGTFFANTKDFFRKWTRDLRDSQSPQGGFPGVAPPGRFGAGDSEMMRLGWADAGVIVPWVVWKQFGDSDIINDNWDSMLKYMRHINDTHYDHNTLSAENGNYQYADWLSYEPLESCGGGIYFSKEDKKKGIRPEAIDYWNYLSANYWLSNAEMMADMARASQRDDAEFKAMAADARLYIKENFLNDDGTFRSSTLNTMQTPALFALRNNLFDGEAKEALKTRLRKNFEEHGNCLQTGFLGTSILMPTLSENGMHDVAYELLFQTKNPSWLYSVHNGATTIWERWNSYTIEDGMATSGMNSFNHYAYGCVCEWIWKTAAGIAADPANPGFRNIIMRPIPDPRLGFVKAEYQSAAGPIRSEWRYEGNNWIWDFEIPEGSTATVTLPGHSDSTTYSAGSHHLELPL